MRDGLLAYDARADEVRQPAEHASIDNAAASSSGDGTSRRHNTSTGMKRRFQKDQPAPQQYQPSG